MRRIKGKFKAGGLAIIAVFVLGAGWPAAALAGTVEAPSLVISQLKITSSNGQFITLYNATDSVLDMSNYQVVYFNNYDLQKATSSKIIGLSGKMPPHSYFILSDDTITLCYRLTIQSQTLGFSSTSGTVEVLSISQVNSGVPSAPILQDAVSWSKSKTSGVQTLPSSPDTFLQRQPIDDSNNPAIDMPGAGSWQEVQPAPDETCELIGMGGGNPSGTISAGAQQLLDSTEPPATILSADNTVDDTGQAHLPPADIGLMAPKITELLPNPAGTGTDANSEFIELYNPNAAVFDLSGFSLEVGTASVHSYVFPANTLLPPKAFRAFYSASTHLSLSNSKGQARLFDPLGNMVSATAAYANAKDGIAWALAKGKWYWTATSTPGAANVIKQPPISKKGAKKRRAKSKISSGVNLNAAALSPLNAVAQPAGGAASRSPVHRGILALVGAAALLYLAYEYRADMANKFFQLRRYFAYRRASRQQS